MANNNSSSLHCFELYETRKYDVIMGLRSGFSFLSFIVIICMMAIIILFKKYLFFTQRLILYLALANLAYSLSAACNLTGRVAYKHIATQYCVFIGFAEQITIWWTLMATACIMIDLFVKAVCKKNTDRLEIVYLFFIFVSPLLFCWIPFIKYSFGADGVFCWIRELNQYDCGDFNFGKWLRYGIYYIPLYLLMILLIVLYIPVVVFVRRRQNRWAGIFNPEAHAIQKMIATEIRPLIYYPLIVIIINVFPLIKQIYATTGHNETVYYFISLFSAAIYPFQGFFVVIAFTLDPETRNKLNGRTIYAALVQCCRKSDVKLYPAQKDRSDSWTGPASNADFPNYHATDSGYKNINMNSIDNVQII